MHLILLAGCEVDLTSLGFENWHNRQPAIHCPPSRVDVIPGLTFGVAIGCSLRGILVICLRMVGMATVPFGSSAKRLQFALHMRAALGHHNVQCTRLETQGVGAPVMLYMFADAREMQMVQ